MIKVKNNFKDLDQIIKKEIKKIEKEAKIMSYKSTFQELPPVVEEMLQIILDNQENYPEVLRKIFNKEIKMSIPYSDERIRSIISKLIDSGMISELQWASNLPWYGRIEEDGFNYFEYKKNKKDEKININVHNNFSNSTFNNSVISIGDNNEIELCNSYCEKLDNLEQEIKKPEYKLSQENIDILISYIQNAKNEATKGKKNLVVKLIQGIWNFVKDLGCQVLATYIATSFQLN